jgi:hypothetical protein
MVNQNLPPGLIQPTVNSYPPGSNSPHTAAKSINDSNNQKLNNINQMAAGSKTTRSKRRKRGGASQVSVPVLKPIYTSQNGPGTDPTSQQAQGQSLSMQSTANAVYDNQASKMGGSRRKYKRGGNPDWIWGCYSGGKKRTTRRKSSKHKKKTRRHRR